MTLYIAPIVEGETEVLSLETLLHKIWNNLLVASIRLEVLPASRGKRDAIVNKSHPELESKINESMFKLSRKLTRDREGRGLLLLLLDAEKDCPADLAPQLLERAKKIRSDISISCVLANRMFENWIVAGASTLAGYNGLPEKLILPIHFEAFNAANWLDARLRDVDKTRKYDKAIDAKLFVQNMNIEDCRQNSPSFDKLCRDLSFYLPAADEQIPPNEESPVDEQPQTPTPPTDSPQG